MKKCPKCKSSSKKRMSRKNFSKFIYNSKAYACDNCNNRYLYIPILNYSISI